MSILIKGAEMPKPGRYEAVIIVLDKSTAEIAISPAEDDIGYWKEYPLVPVPEHGRLGDLDELLDRAFGCLDEETFLAFQFLVNGSVTIISANKEGEG